MQPHNLAANGSRDFAKSKFVLFDSTLQHIKGFRCAIDVSSTPLGTDAHLTRTEWDLVLKGIQQIGDITSDSWNDLDKRLNRLVSGLNSQHAAQRLTFQSSVEKKSLFGKHRVSIFLRVYEEEDERSFNSKTTPEQSARESTQLLEEPQPTIARRRTEHTVQTPGGITAAEARRVSPLGLLNSVKSLPQMAGGSAAGLDAVRSMPQMAGGNTVAEDARRNVGSAIPRCAFGITNCFPSLPSSSSFLVSAA